METFGTRLTRSGYREIRKNIRSRILINSRNAIKLRFVFDDTKVLVGGVVVREQEMVETSDAGKTPNVGLTVFDCSGTFDVWGFKQDLTEETYQRLFSVNIGDVVFILGQVNPIMSCDGYFVLPELVMNEQEFEEYRLENKSELLTMKKKIELALEEDREEDLGLMMMNRRQRMDVIRPFLKKDKRLKDDDLYWLLMEIKYWIRRKPARLSAKLKMLHSKYERLYQQTQEQ